MMADAHVGMDREEAQISKTRQCDISWKGKVLSYPIGNGHY